MLKEISISQESNKVKNNETKQKRFFSTKPLNLNSIPISDRTYYSHRFSQKLSKALDSNNSSKNGLLTTNDTSTETNKFNTIANFNYNYNHEETLKKIQDNIIEPMHKKRNTIRNNSIQLKNNVNLLENNVKQINLQLNNSNSNNNNLIIESNKFRCDYSEKICENENLEEEINTLKIINKKLIDRINYFDNQTFSINSFNKNNFEEIQKMKKEIKDIKEQIKKLENDIKNNRSIIILFNGKSNELKVELENFKNKNELVGKGFEYLMKQYY